MKHLRKRLMAIVAAAVAVVMAVALVPTAYAADGATTNSLTIHNTGATEHRFELYQIFTGKLEGGTLSDVQWGSGVSAAGQAALGNASDKAETLKNEADATAFAQTLVAGKDGASYLVFPTTSTPVASEGNYAFNNLEAGYYLVKDANSSQTGSDTLQNSAYTSYIVQVVGTVTQDTKLNVPSVEKKVKETNDSSGNITPWQDAADYDIGDAVPFRLVGTLPSNYAAYKTYKYQFNDTPSAGLTYKNDAKVYVYNGPDSKTDVTSSFTSSTSSDGKTFTFTCDDLKAIPDVTINKDSSIIVEYTATLNGSAKIGAAGNPNEVSLTYSNNPNYTGEGANSPTGETPKDKVIVFTYKTVVNKVDKDNNPLSGAGFTLKKWIHTGKDADGTEQGKWQVVDTISAGDNTTEFEFKGLDDGKYQLVESTTPAGYNSISPIEFTITAEFDRESDDPKLTSLSGNLISGTAAFHRDAKNDDALTTDVVNKSGSTLPSTGGIGTTVLYIAGAAVAAAAAAGIYMLRRHSSNA